MILSFLRTKSPPLFLKFVTEKEALAQMAFSSFKNSKISLQNEDL